MRIADALAELRRMAAGLEDEEPAAASRRLLERVSAREDAEELRAALVELGAVALIDPIGALALGDDEGQ